MSNVSTLAGRGDAVGGDAGPHTFHRAALPTAGPWSPLPPADCAEWGAALHLHPRGELVTWSHWVPEGVHSCLPRPFHTLEEETWTFSDWPTGSDTDCSWNSCIGQETEPITFKVPTTLRVYNSHNSIFKF